MQRALASSAIISSNSCSTRVIKSSCLTHYGPVPWTMFAATRKTPGSDLSGKSIQCREINRGKAKMSQSTDQFRCDVREPLPAVKNVEQIYHLACPASPDHFEVSPIEIMDTCFQGTKNAFDLALKHNARVLITSTSGGYSRYLPTKASSTQIC
jgi:nucleoside-diphosphate-sugar epimerase